MKTTVDIGDGLLSEAKRVTRREGTTLKALIEEGLRHVLKGRDAHAPFQLRKASFKGHGLQPEAREGSWERIRAMVYEGHGA